jgi:hypothetical protein
VNLLRRLLPSQDIDALLGDLCEEYQHGRSTIWYWMQIVAAIVVGSWKEARTNKSVALGAIAAGVGFQIAVGSGLLFVRVAVRQAGYPVTWLIADLLHFSGDVAVGWVFVRLYRSYGITMLLVFRAAMLTVLLILFLWSASVFAIRTGILPVALALEFRSALTRFAFQSILMFAGGYLATRRPEAI